jgi:hypothetical protein
MTDDIETDRDLEAFLASARDARPGPDLVTRVLADAARVQAEAAAPAPRRRRGFGGLWRDPPGVIAALGGWAGASGVTAAGLVGLAVGFLSPDAIGAFEGAGVLSLTSVSEGWTPDLAELALEDGDV